MRLNPLAKYLREQGLTQIEFARRIELGRGWPCGQSQVARWCAGRQLPSLASRVQIEAATGGEVPRSVWGKDDDTELEKESEE